MSKTKYILIERPECLPTAVSSAVFETMKADGDEIISSRPITLKEIKQDRVFVCHDDVYHQHRAYEIFRKRFEGHVFKATVLWFNKRHGTGMIKGLNEEGNWFLYACNIPGKKTWYEDTACVYFEEGAVIDVEIHPYPKNSIVVAHTKGLFDKEKWDSLDQDRLAFKCNEDGEPITGLGVDLWNI